MKKTSFFSIYCKFLDKIQDEMMMELSMEDTLAIIQSILLDSLTEFDYPKFNINDYDLYEITEDAVNEDGEAVVTGAFQATLTNEEQDIIAELMLHEWYRRQLSTTRLVQMRYSTSDFKQTSQAAHMQRLDSLIKEHRKVLYRKQRMYGRRKLGEDGIYYADYKGLSGVGERDYKKIWTKFGEVR